MAALSSLIVSVVFLAAARIEAVGSSEDEQHIRWQASGGSFSRSSAKQHLMRADGSLQEVQHLLTPPHAALLGDASGQRDIVLTYSAVPATTSGKEIKLPSNESELFRIGKSKDSETTSKQVKQKIVESPTEGDLEQEQNLEAAEPTFHKAMLSAPGRFEVLNAFLLSTCAAAAIVISAIVILSHFQVGRLLTGLYIPHSSSAAYIGLVWSLPVFALLGVAGIIMPELLPVWQFLETLLLAGTFSRMPDIFMQIVGGRLQLQLRLNSYLTGTKSDELQDADMSDGRGTGMSSKHEFTHWLLCCRRRAAPPRPPQPQHVAPLHVTVTLICYMLPIVSFFKLFWSLEVEIGSPSAQEWFVFLAPWVIITMRLLEMVSIDLGLSALNGLEAIVTTLSPKAANDLKLPFKLLYCQAYMIGLRLIPMLFGLIPLWGFSHVPEPRVLQVVRSVVVCIASLVCASLAWHAFPADERHYPELSAVNSEIRPVLDQVKFCPFCGADGLELNTQTLGAENVFCPRCCAYDVPPRLVIARVGLQKHVRQQSTEEHASMKTES